MAFQTILFDGECNFCDRMVRFLITKDPAGRFRFASLPSSYGQQVLRTHGLPLDDFDTFVLVEGLDIYTASDAGVRVFRELGWPWRALALASFLPPKMRDYLYFLLARNRYRWFGRRQRCDLPSADVRERFLQ